MHAAGAAPRQMVGDQSRFYTPSQVYNGGEMLDINAIGGAKG
jgi:hypothetical protein